MILWITIFLYLHSFEFSFIFSWYSPTGFVLCSSVEGNVGTYYFLAITATMNMNTQENLYLMEESILWVCAKEITYFGYYSSISRFLYFFLWHLKIAFWSCWRSLDSHQWWIRSLFSPYLLQYLLPLLLLMQFWMGKIKSLFL